MYYLIYLSAANNFMDDEELKKILSSSRKNNEENHLTGVLLYGNGQFIQLLEGEQETVERIFAVISSDKRHLAVTVIASGPLNQRCFPEWHMGFKAIDPAAEPEVAFPDDSKLSADQHDCEFPVKILQSFMRKNRLIL